MRRLNSPEILSELLGSLCLLLLVAALVLAMPEGVRADTGGNGGETAPDCTDLEDAYCVCQRNDDGTRRYGVNCIFCLEGDDCICTRDTRYDPPIPSCVLAR